MPANNTEIEKRLWAAADELRANSRLRASEYSVPVLGLIFLKYADCKFARATERLQGPDQEGVAQLDLFGDEAPVRRRGGRRLTPDRMVAV
jgi:type I restriction enzyme M protein